jgi:hypothetical protein
MVGYFFDVQTDGDEPKIYHLGTVAKRLDQGIRANITGAY